MQLKWKKDAPVVRRLKPSNATWQWLREGRLGPRQAKLLVVVQCGNNFSAWIPAVRGWPFAGTREVADPAFQYTH